MKWTPVVKVNVPDHIASPQMCEVNKIHQILQAVSVKKLGESLWLVDMGKVQTGWFEMQMPILPAGHEVIMEYSDNLTKDGEFDKQGESDIIYLVVSKENTSEINSIITLSICAHLQSSSETGNRCNEISANLWRL